MRKFVLVVSIVALAALGCSTSTVGGPAPDAISNLDGGADAPSFLDAPPDTPGGDVVAHEYTAAIEFALAPAQENTMCMLARLGNRGPEYLRRIRAHLGDTSHHLIVYRSGEATERTTPFACRGFSGVLSASRFESPLLIAQNADAQLEMPAGVGINLAANQMYRLEFHAVNTTGAPERVRAEIRLDTVEQTSAVTPADVLFWGNVNISIPPRVPTTVHFFHRPWSGARIFALTSHTHARGLRSTISVATNATNDSSRALDTRLVHVSNNPLEPPLTTFDPPLRLAAGEGLHLACDYLNNGTQPIGFGESVDAEMCFQWAYYYPAVRGTQICAEGYDGSKSTLCLPP